jgi:hypothetical protein
LAHVNWAGATGGWAPCAIRSGFFDFGWRSDSTISPGGIWILDMSADSAPLLIVVALFWLVPHAYRDWWFLARLRRHALGTVIGHRRISGEGGEMMAPIIRFEDDHGRTIDITGSFNARPIDKGSTVGIEYPAGFPQKARMMGSHASFLEYSLGLVVLALSIALMVNPNGWLMDRLFGR